MLFAPNSASKAAVRFQKHSIVLDRFNRQINTWKEQRNRLDHVLMLVIHRATGPRWITNVVIEVKVTNLLRLCLYGGGPALLLGLALFCFRLYYKRASPSWRDLAIDLTETSPRRAGNFHINALKRADPLGGLASQSSVHTTKVVLTSIF